MATNAPTFRDWNEELPEPFWIQQRRLNRVRHRNNMIFRWLAWALAAILFEGAARKWFLPSSLAFLAYFAKDAVAGLFLLTVRPARQPSWAHELEQYVLGVGICLAFSFADGLFQFPIGAIVVYKNAVLWPLFAIRMASVINQQIVNRLWKFLVAAGGGIALLASAQYFSPPSSILNRYAWEAEKWGLGAATAGDFVRATGTFSFIAGLSSFGLVLFCLSVGRLVSLRDSRDLPAAVGGLVSAATCGLLSGSRSVEVSMAAILSITLFTMPRKQTARLAVTLAVLALVFGALWNSSFASGVLARWNGTQEGEIQDRALGQGLGQPIDVSLIQHPLGIGLGLYSGFSSYSGKQESLDLPYNENIQSRIATEAGLPALVALFLSAALLIRAGEWIWKRKTVPKARAIPFAAGALMAIITCQWYDHTGTGLWWWSTGFLLGECMNLAKTDPTSNSTLG